MESIVDFTFPVYKGCGKLSKNLHHPASIAGLVPRKIKTPCGVNFGGGDVPKLEPKRRLNLWILDTSIQKLRAIYKAHPQWFEVPKPKSDKGKNVVDYSIK